MRSRDLAEYLDVERRVSKPGLRQWPGRPVDGRVLLGKGEPEIVLDDGSEPDPRQTDEPSSELGVEQSRRMQANLRQARQILGGGVQDPLDIGQGVCDGREIGTRDRVEQPGARALAPDLDEICPLAIAVAGRALRVDRRRTGASSKERGRADQSTLVHDHVRDAIRGHVQGNQERSDEHVLTGEVGIALDGAHRRVGWLREGAGSGIHGANLFDVQGQGLFDLRAKSVGR